MTSLHEITLQSLEEMPSTWFCRISCWKPVSCCIQILYSATTHNWLFFIFNVNVKLIMLLKHLCETNYVVAHVKQLQPTYIN